MARACSLRNIKVQSGNNVSHSQRKTRRRFMPNLQKISLLSDILGQNIRLRVTASTLRTIEVYGGLDHYLLAAREDSLTAEGIRIRNKIKNKLEAK